MAGLRQAQAVRGVCYCAMELVERGLVGDTVQFSVACCSLPVRFLDLLTPAMHLRQLLLNTLSY